MVGRLGTVVLGLGNEEEGEDEGDTGEDSTKTIPPFGCDGFGDGPGKDDKDSSQDGLNSLLDHHASTSLMKEEDFLSSH